MKCDLCGDSIPVRATGYSVEEETLCKKCLTRGAADELRVAHRQQDATT